jgi:hypothetical protein
MALKLIFLDSVAQHDEGVDAFAEHRTWLRHHRDLDDCGMFEQDVLDLGGVDLIPAAVDDVLDAIDDAQASLAAAVAPRADRPADHSPAVAGKRTDLFIHDPEIAGLPISGAELALGGLGLVEVARHNHGAADIDFAKLSVRSLNAP